MKGCLIHQPVHTVSKAGAVPFKRTDAGTLFHGNPFSASHVKRRKHLHAGDGPGSFQRVFMEACCFPAGSGFYEAFQQAGIPGLPSGIDWNTVRSLPVHFLNSAHAQRFAEEHLMCNSLQTQLFEKTFKVSR